MDDEEMEANGGDVQRGGGAEWRCAPFVRSSRLWRLCSRPLSSLARRSFSSFVLRLFIVAVHSSRGSYVGIQSAGFRDFLLKPELLLAITDCGFEHPSEGQLTRTQ